MHKRIFFVFFFIGINCTIFAQYNVESVPDPKRRGQEYFVSNPDGILSSSTENRLNELCKEIETNSSAEVAIVIVNDFYGGSDFDFAYNLFNYWGVGKNGNNNGLLLFVAKEKRKYQFITGYGMEGRLTDVTLGEIGSTYLVPHFKEGDYNGGVLAAIAAISNILSDPENAILLKSSVKERSVWSKYKLIFISVCLLPLLIFVSFRSVNSATKDLKLKKVSAESVVANGCISLFFIFFAVLAAVFFLHIDVESLLSLKFIAVVSYIVFCIALFTTYGNGRNRIFSTYKDEVNILTAWQQYNKKLIIPFILCPFLFIMIIGYRKRKSQLVSRLIPPDDSGNWKRLNRDEIKSISKYLQKSHLNEEKIKSISYEIWQNVNSQNIKLVAWRGTAYKKYYDCPKCKFHTLTKTYTKTVRAATYSSSGVGEKVQDCENCGYQQSFGTVILPKLERSSSSSGSSFSSGSSSASSSSGGSWGGGRSGGGGAGGSW